MLGVTALQFMLGLRISWKHLELLPSQRHTIVSNHITTGDVMILYSLLQPTVHLVSASLPKPAYQVLNSSFVGSFLLLEGDMPYGLTTCDASFPWWAEYKQADSGTPKAI